MNRTLNSSKQKVSANANEKNCDVGFDKCIGHDYCDTICIGFNEYCRDEIMEKCRKLGMTEHQSELCCDFNNSTRIERKKANIHGYIQEFIDRILHAGSQWKKSLNSGPGICSSLDLNEKRDKDISFLVKKILAQEYYCEEVVEAIELSRMPECLRDIFFVYCSHQYHVYGADKYNPDNDGHPNGYANLIKFLRILNGDNLDDEEYGMWGTKKKIGKNMIPDRESFVSAMQGRQLPEKTGGRG